MKTHKANIVTNVFCILIFIVFVSSCQNNSRKNIERIERQKNSLKDHIGEEFNLDNILDSNGNLVKLDFTKSEITIVDFWFNECPPCIEEMKQFAEILLGKEKKITIISISINRFSLWKSTLREHVNKFSFLANNTQNWYHYTLNSREEDKLKNDVPIINQIKLQSKYNVTFFPAFFVINKLGIIESRPISAVRFINQLNVVGK